MKLAKHEKIVAIILALIVSTGQGIAFVPTGEPRTPNFDKRREEVPGLQLTPERQQAAARLQARLPSVRIDYDEITGTPRWVSSTISFLSGPPELELQRAGKLGLAIDDPHRGIKAFLVENEALFEHGVEVLTDAVITRDFVTPHSGMRTVVWEQN